MTFSQFVQTLYPYFREGKTEGEFVTEIISQIMHGQPGRAHSDGTYQNPLLDIDERNWIYYYSGKRTIPQKYASRILSSIDKSKFEKYLHRHCSKDALIHIKKDLSKTEKIPSGDAASACADLLEKILHDIVA